MTVTVKIENAYSDGHQSERLVELPAPLSSEVLDAWWEEVVFPETGDGHGADSDLGSCYTATIVAVRTSAQSELLGQSEEWID